MSCTLEIIGNRQTIGTAINDLKSYTVSFDTLVIALLLTQCTED